jgi:imidazolonepropionase-like amidohydrolase
VSGYALVGGDVIAASMVSDTTILVTDGRIQAVGPRAEIAVSDDWDVIDVSGLFLMPGFIDAHVHIGLYEPLDVLRGGVTTVRDLAWPPEVIFPLVERSSDDDFLGPTVVAAGQMLTVEDGYPTRASWAPPGTGRVVRSIEDAHVAVAEQIASGACTIKVALNAQTGPTLDLETLRTIIEAAHERGLRVTGHVYGLDELHKALDAGMDELAHMLMSPERIPDDTIARMTEAGMVVVPTLSCFFGRAQKIAIDNLERFFGAGGIVAYGTDLGNEGPVPGIDPREVNAMASAGMSAFDIVASATTVSAELLGLADTGAIAPGMWADIVGVEVDPISDVRSLTDVKLVIRHGRKVEIQVEIQPES